MKAQQIEQTLQNYLQDQHTLTGEFSKETSLISSGVLDSLAIFNFIEFIESQFEVRFDVDELAPENFDSIQAATSMTLKKTLKKEGSL